MLIGKTKRSIGVLNVIVVYVKKNKLKTGYAPKWFQAGYRKKTRCELCGFRSSNPIQMDVYHVDGNRDNVSTYNLKTICANC